MVPGARPQPELELLIILDSSILNATVFMYRCTIFVCISKVCNFVLLLILLIVWCVALSCRGPEFVRETVVFHHNEQDPEYH